MVRSQKYLLFYDHKTINCRHARWLLFFSSFHFVIKPRAGIDNAQAVLSLAALILNQRAKN